MSQRKTDIDVLLFPVALEPIYLANEADPVGDFRAIAGYPHGPGEKTVFTVVTGSYQLLTNQEAIGIAGSVYQNVFKAVDLADMEVFNLTYPTTKSFCHIDIIQRNHQVNLWAGEVHLPFIRVTNSYNRTRKLVFELGFCRKLCNNGVIFEKETITFSYTHTKGVLNIDQIEKQLAADNRLSRLEASFVAWMEQLQHYPVADKYMLALCARIINVNFDIEAKDWTKRKTETDRLVQFQQKMGYLKGKYCSEMGQTAYAVYNMATDYTTHATGLLHVDSQQARVGTWLGEFCRTVADRQFSMDSYLADYKGLIG